MSQMLPAPTPVRFFQIQKLRPGKVFPWRSLLHSRFFPRLASDWKPSSSRFWASSAPRTVSAKALHHHCWVGPMIAWKIFAGMSCAQTFLWFSLLLFRSHRLSLRRESQASREKTSRHFCIPGSVRCPPDFRPETFSCCSQKRHLATVLLGGGGYLTSRGVNTHRSASTLGSCRSRTGPGTDPSRPVFSLCSVHNGVWHANHPMPMVGFAFWTRLGTDPSCHHGFKFVKGSWQDVSVLAGLMHFFYIKTGLGRRVWSARHICSRQQAGSVHLSSCGSQVCKASKGFEDQRSVC